MRAIRNRPSFWWQLGAFVCFGTALLVARGVRALLVAIAVVAVIGVAVFYPYYRRHPNDF